MKKLLAILLTLALSLSFTAALADTVTIGVPNDTTNEARALLLLQANGIIKLAMGSGIQATVRDIVENPYNVEIVEIEAAQLPVQLPDLDYAVINSNYAISADLNPVKDSLLLEGSYSAYGNILAVKEGTEESDKVKALVAALESKQVADFITETYNGSVVSTVENPTDGYDATVDYDALKGQKITVAASPTPHAEILKVAQEILAAKDVELEIVEFTDYVQPNLVVDNGEIDTKLVSVSVIHVEPMGLYGGRQTTLDALGLSKYNIIGRKCRTGRIFLPVRAYERRKPCD